jgi:hypothetical protein
MKNKKVPSICILSIATLALLAPLSAHANLGLNLNGVLSGKASESNLGLKAEARADLGVQNRSSDNNRQDKKENNKSDDKDNMKRDASNTKDRDDRQIPPGIEKKLDNDSWFKFGWFKKWFGSNATTTANVFPTIRNAEVRGISTSTAEIRWSTNASTTSEIRYGTDASTVNTSTNIITDSTLSTDHKTVLTGLTTDTKYYLQITARDSNGNTKQSGVVSFKTKSDASVDITAPSILFSTVLSIGSDNARILWITNEPSNSKVWVSQSEDVSISGTETAGSLNLSYVHDMKVNVLKSATKYFYKVRSVDASGNVTVSAVGSFTTK